MKRPFPNPAVQAAFAGLPQGIALVLRDLIFATAEDIPEAGEVLETLRWGQPSYIATHGSMLRIGAVKKGGCGLFAHCQTNIVSSFAATFPGADVIDGNRGVIFQTKDEIDPQRLRHFIRHGLTYRLKRKEI